MRLGDVIFALASAPGPSGHAIIRASGPASPDVLNLIAPDRSPRFNPSRADIRLLDLGPGLRLPARVLTFVAPRSFTGEHAFELIVPGGALVPRAVLARLGSIEGTRPALPGEFSARAFLNGRLSADDAERLPALIAARTRAEVSAARAGAADPHLAAWADRLAHLLALVESAIDFVDQEDVRPIEPGDLHRALLDLRARVASRLARGQASRAEPLVVLAGRPSAGKSSLFNALLGFTHTHPRGLVRALTHEAPGTTRDVLRATLELGPGRSVTLIDTPGVDEITRDPRTPHAAAQRAARAAAVHADILIWCDPLAQAPDPAHTPHHPSPPSADLPSIFVRTKADRPGSTPPPWLPVCALDGRGVSALKDAITHAASRREPEPVAPPSERQARAMHAALADLDEALSHAHPDRPGPGEIIAEHLRGALRALGEVSRPLGVEEVLARIFARSCIGK